MSVRYVFPSLWTSVSYWHLTDICCISIIIPYSVVLYILMSLYFVLYSVRNIYIKKDDRWCWKEITNQYFSSMIFFFLSQYNIVCQTVMHVRLHVLLMYTITDHHQLYLYTQLSLVLFTFGHALCWGCIKKQI